MFFSGREKCIYALTGEPLFEIKTGVHVTSLLLVRAEVDKYKRSPSEKAKLLENTEKMS